jgi:cytochrome c553
MSDNRLYTWSNPWFRWSVTSLVVLMIASLFVGFVWLPSANAGFSAQGIWATICRAAGVPADWGVRDAAAKTQVQSTRVVLEPAMGRAGQEDAVGRGATLALQQCTMCHGARGLSEADAPNLAGQYPEVIIKQMHDYKNGHRASTIMEALAKNLADGDILDLAAYYDSLPKARKTPEPYIEDVPPLVRVGDPLRNIAPCATCHGGIDRKFGTPWLEGMPREYLVTQLRAFASGTRRNDSHAQMRNMARLMKPQEIEEVAEFYARYPEGVARR